MMVVKNKSRRTLEEIAETGYCSIEDFIILRNILINDSFVIVGNKQSGVPLLVAMLCDVYREELKTRIYTIFEEDTSYDYKIQKSLGDDVDRILFQNITNINTLFDAEMLVERGKKVMAIVDPDSAVPLNFNGFKYVIELETHNSEINHNAHIKSITKIN